MPPEDWLRAERARLCLDVDARRAELDRLADSVVNEGRDDEHDPDGSTPAFSYSLAAGLLAAAEAQLRDVDAAIGRARSGSYGICGQCGRPIPPERLRAVPTTERCAPCATRQTHPLRRK